MTTKTMYVCSLPQNAQNQILADLQALHLSEEDIQNAMDSRLCDLEETLDIHIYMNMERRMQINKNKGIVRKFIAEAETICLYDKNDNLKGKGTHWIFSDSSGNEIIMCEKLSTVFHNIKLTGITEVRNVDNNTLLVTYEDGRFIKIRNINN